MVMPVVLATVALVLAFLLAIASRTKPKRFGLSEAEAAMRYTGKDPDTAKAVKGVVVGVLGFTDTVADDIRAKVAELDEAETKREGDEGELEKQIALLQAKIQSLHIDSEMYSNRVDQVHKVGDLFA